MKVFHWILAALFTLFAWFQLNDPDAVLWTSVYGLVALLCGILAYRQLPAWIPGVAAGLLAGWAAFHFPYFWDYLTNQDGYSIAEAMSYDKPYIEGTREFFGLVLASAALMYHFFRLRKAAWVI